MEVDKTNNDIEDAFINITRIYGSSEDHCAYKDYVEMLIHEEKSWFGFMITDVGQSIAVVNNWNKCTRFEAITWTLKAREFFGFRLETAYLSMTYFDRFIARRSIHNGKYWAIRLLSVACLSLAAKMEEVEVPSLCEFGIITEDFGFETGVVGRMELLVLTTLEWKMNYITPFAFLPYFIVNFLEESPSRDVISRIFIFLIHAMREVNLTDHRPSSIAVAATLVALDQRLTRKALEGKLKSVSCSQHIDIEDVFKFDSLMQHLEHSTKNLLNSPGPWPTELRRMDDPGGSFVTSVTSMKRTRLAFEGSGVPQDKRPREN